MSTWSSKEIATLKKMWLAGESDEAIQKALPKRSAGAITGKAYGIGLRTEHRTGHVPTPKAQKGDEEIPKTQPASPPRDIASKLKEVDPKDGVDLLELQRRIESGRYRY